MSIDFNNVLEQAQQLKKEFEKKQKEFASKEFNATSGGGIVKVTLNGSGKVTDIIIDPKTLKEESPQIIQDLIMAAFNSAKSNLDNESSDMMSGMPGGNLNIPGLDKIF